MKYYYASPDNKTTGPVTVEEIQALIKSGTLKSDPMVVPEGSSDWRPLSAYLTNPPGNGTPPPPPPAHAGSVAADKALAASKDALTAFKIFATNPVGGLPTAYESLGSKRGLAAGAAFGTLSVIFLVAASYRITSGGYVPRDFDFFIKTLLLSIVPFALFFGASAGTRMLFGGVGEFGQDCFIAGASVVPIVIVAVLTTLLGESGGRFLAICAVLAHCLTVLMLFSGLTRVSKVSERVASFVVPIVFLIVTYVLSKMLVQLVMSALFGGSSGGMPGF